MSLFRAAGALKENGGIRAEFVDHLPASTTRSARHSLIIGDGNRLDFDFGPEVGDSREDRGAFGAVRHPVGRVLHVASRIDLAVRE